MAKVPANKAKQIERYIASLWLQKQIEVAKNWAILLVPRIANAHVYSTSSFEQGTYRGAVEMLYMLYDIPSVDAIVDRVECSPDRERQYRYAKQLTCQAFDLKETELVPLVNLTPDWSNAWDDYQADLRKRA